MKQHALAMHTFAEAWGGKLPVHSPQKGDISFEELMRTRGSSYTFPRPPAGPSYDLLYGEIYGTKVIDREAQQLLLNPADPSIRRDCLDFVFGNSGSHFFEGPLYLGDCSYPLNGLVVADRANPKSITNSFPDGLSNTILIAERYANCESSGVQPAMTPWSQTFRTSQHAQSGDSMRPPTFADPLSPHDVRPARDPLTGGTVASVRGKTFQSQPAVGGVRPDNPQHAVPGNVGGADGRQRPVGPPRRGRGRVLGRGHARRRRGRRARIAVPDPPSRCTCPSPPTATSAWPNCSPASPPGGPRRSTNSRASTPTWPTSCANSGPSRSSPTSPAASASTLRLLPRRPMACTPRPTRRPPRSRRRAQSKPNPRRGCRATSGITSCAPNSAAAAWASSTRRSRNR